MIKSVIKSVIGNTGNAITGKASGSWSSYWTQRYNYSKLIPITGASGAGTDYQVLLIVNSGVGADSNGVVYLNNHSLKFPYDIAFIDFQDRVAIPFYIDPILGSATQKYIWVRPTTDLSSGIKYIQIYYGRTIGYDLSDGDTTFNLFDNFDNYRNTEAVENFTTLTQLEALIEPNKYKGNPVILHGGGGWKDSQVHFPQIIIDPTDSTKLIMFLGGMAAPVSSGVCSIGRFTGTVADPYTWVEYGSNPILQKGAGGAWDNYGVIGPDTVFWNPDDSLFYMYYTGYKTGPGVADQIGLATSSDGITWTKHVSNPILTPAGNGRNDGNSVSTCSVIRDGVNWYMYYSYRNGGTVLPGIRVASSADGVTWTKQGVGDLITVGASYDSTYIEGAQAIKLGTKYVLIYSCYNGLDWTTSIASSDNYDSGFTKSNLNPVFGGSGMLGDWDSKHISTFHIFNMSNKWYAFYQGNDGSGPTYGEDNWDLGVTTFDLEHRKRYLNNALNGQNGWTAEAEWTLSGIKKEGLTSAKVTGYVAQDCNATKVYPSINSIGAISFYFMDSAYTVATNKYTISFYVLEGATQITGITVLNKTLQHLKSAAWENIQTVVVNTWYKITIAFPSKSTHLIYINDVLQGALATSNINNIITAPTSIKIQRYDVLAGIGYFDHIILREYLTSPPVVGTAEAEVAV